MTKFNVGDKVKITKKAKSHENGWGDSWVSLMDRAVGKIGTVVSDCSVYPHSVEVEIPGITTRFFYPDFVLEKIESESISPLVATTDPKDLKEDVALAARFKIGDLVRVSFPDYNALSRQAFVKAVEGNGYVRVKYSDGVAPNLYPQRLTLIESVKDVKTAATALSVVEVAKAEAKKLAIANGVVDADKVQEKLVELGYNSGMLGNAAGTIFRGKNWKKTGSKKSTRPGNNSRTISTWRYVGA